MARCIGRQWLQAGGSPGGNGGGEWNVKDVYRSLAAAYGWTYYEIDQHTLAEANELFSGWSEFPPTNLLVKALVEGLGGGTKPKVDPEVDVPPEALAAMQRSAVGAISAKAGPRLPVVKGPDPGLPKTAPVFDIEELRRRNEDISRRRAMMKVQQSV